MRYFDVSPGWYWQQRYELIYPQINDMVKLIYGVDSFSYTKR